MLKLWNYFFEKKLIIKTILEFIHFGLTSQDVNSSSYVLSMKEANQEIIIPSCGKDDRHDSSKIKRLAYKFQCLSRTHGQPASPTTLGKELMVFVERMENTIRSVKRL